MKHKKTAILPGLVLALMLCLTGCELPKFVKADDYMVYEADPARPVTRLTAVLTAEEVAALDETHPGLQKADFTGSTCYPELLAYTRAHPEVEVQYTVTINNKEYDRHTISVNLSDMDPKQVDNAGAMLQHLPKLRYVELMKEDGTCKLSKEQVKTLQSYIPKVDCNYSFDLFGVSIQASASVLELKNVPVYDSGLEEVKAAMKFMPNLKAVRLDNCGTTSEAMNDLRTASAGIDVHWRVWFGKYTCMTDEKVLRLTNGLKNEHLGELKYCIDAEYVDIGHNEYLSDISFFQYMPKLKLLIASGTNVSDISPLKGLKELEFLELVFCSGLTDLSPLSESTGLKYLNVSITGVSNLEPLKNCPLERFVAMSTKQMTQSQREAFAEAHPDCLRLWYGSQPYGYGWRYSDQGYTFYKYYADMRDIFDYDDKYKYTGRDYRGTKIKAQ